MKIKNKIHISILVSLILTACTVGTTNRVIVNQYSDSDSSKVNISNIYIQKDTIKTKVK